MTIHEAPISKHGFTGSGYQSIDPETGAGGYIIEGGGRGGVLDRVGSNSVLLSFAFFTLGLIAGAAGGALIIGLVAMVALVISLIAFAAKYLETIEQAPCPEAIPCIKDIFLKTLQFAVALALLGAIPGVKLIYSLAAGLNGLIWGDDFAGAASRGCVLRCQRTG